MIINFYKITHIFINIILFMNMFTCFALYSIQNFILHCVTLRYLPTFIIHYFLMLVN